MSDIAIDLSPASSTYNELLVVNGDLVLTSDADPNGTNNILQDIIQRLRSFMGEWFLDTSFGTPWFQELLIKGARQVDIDSALQTVIINTPGVAILTAYKSTVNFDRRTVSVTFSALTTTGSVDYTLTAGASS